MARPHRHALSACAEEPPEARANRQTASLAALALLLGLVVLGLVLIRTLRHEGQVEDCLMQNRLNCDQLTEPAP